MELNNANANPPYRLREARFCEYAPVIASVLNAWPKPVTFGTYPRSADTFRNQLWDAMNAKRRLGYRHDIINESLWTAHEADIIAVIDDIRTVTVGNRAEIAKLRGTAKTATPQVTTPASNVITLARNDFEIIESICRLLHNKVFDTQITFAVKLTPDVATNLQHFYDIWLEKQTGTDTYHIS